MTAYGASARREWNPAGVMARLGALIDERDAGDPARAASRLGVSVDALSHLPHALADDSRDDLPAAAHVLAAAARAYRVDATWLVTGEEDFHGEDLAPAARIRVADLLLRVGQQLLAARHRGRGGVAERDVAADGVMPAERDAER